jgi:hypothetical protein
MATRYLLPCTCGKKTPVAAAQAGEIVNCPCGAPLTVPTLRGLRDLEIAAEATARPQKRGWTATQGYLFSCGILVAMLGAAIGAWQFLIYVELEPYTADQTAAANANMDAGVDKMTLLETLDEWQHNLQHGLGSDGMPGWIAAQNLSVAHRRSALIAFIAAGLGLLAVVASFFVGRTRAA